MYICTGTVIGNRGRTKCEVEFDDFDRQIVFVNNLIPTQGSTSRPKVKVCFSLCFIVFVSDQQLAMCYLKRDLLIFSTDVAVWCYQQI